MKQLRPFVNLFVYLILCTPLSSFSQTFSLLKDINPGISGTDEFFPVFAGGTTYFVANDGTSGNELWKTDGTTAGTVMVKDINPGPDGSMNGLLVEINGIIFFSANDGVHGNELWKSDGTDAGTVMIKDIRPGPISGCRQFTTLTTLGVNGSLFFAANDGNTGIELWKSDGTDAGTVLVKDINPGRYTSGLELNQPKRSDPFDLTLVNGMILFSATNEATGDELWRTDGTDAGTTLVKDIQPGALGCSMKDCIAINGSLYFIAHNWNDYILYKSDGTDAGTVPLKTMDPNYSYKAWPVNVNNTLYFLDEDGLWKSNGTSLGTVRIRATTETPKFLTNVNGLMYFSGNDISYGRELWKSDGTVEGTVMVKDITAGSANSDFQNFSKVGNKLVFSVDDGIHGFELWTSDGSESGTQLLQEVGPGSTGVNESLIIEAGTHAIAVINTSDFGNELWVANIGSPILLPLTFLEFKGSLLNQDGILQWRTDNELGTSAFVIERSLDGNVYKQAGYVNASNASGTHSYNFKDPGITALGSQVIYYRLKEMDINGKFTYSKVITLSIESRPDFVKIYPNPVLSDINLTVTLSQQMKLNWKLVDYSGRVITSGVRNFGDGNNSFTIPGRGLASGTYFMQIDGVGLHQVIRVVKQ